MGKKPLTKRQVRAIETKARIYNAAIELMDRRGFEAITIADISRKAGVSVGAFYHYFKSKNDILAEIFRKGDEYFRTVVLPGLNRKGCRRQIMEYFEHYAKFNVLTGVETTKELFSPKIKFFIRKERPMLIILRDVIRKGQEKREIRTDQDADELVRFLFLVARGVVFEWSLHEGRYDLQQAMRKYMEIVVSTLQR